MAGMGRHNPLTSEAEAFRWLIVIAAGGATVVVISLLTRPLFAAIWALLLIAAGLLFIWRLWQRPDGQDGGPQTRGGDGRYRILLLANQTVRSPALLMAAVEAVSGRDSEILLVVPALVSSDGSGSWELEAAAEHARQRMELTLLDLKQEIRSARGRVEHSEPNRALRNALAEFPADEIIVSTLPRDRSHWLEQGVVERARIEIDIPVRHVVGDEPGGS